MLGTLQTLTPGCGQPVMALPHKGLAEHSHAVSPPRTPHTAGCQAGATQDQPQTLLILSSHSLTPSCQIKCFSPLLVPPASGTPPGQGPVGACGSSLLALSQQGMAECRGKGRRAGPGYFLVISHVFPESLFLADPTGSCRTACHSLFLTSTTFLQGGAPMHPSHPGTDVNLGSP